MMFIIYRGISATMRQRDAQMLYLLVSRYIYVLSLGRIGDATGCIKSFDGRPSVCSSVRLSVRLSIRPSVRCSVRLFIRVSVRLSVRLPVVFGWPSVQWECFGNFTSVCLCRAQLNVRAINESNSATFYSRSSELNGGQPQNGLIKSSNCSNSNHTTNGQTDRTLTYAHHKAQWSVLWERHNWTSLPWYHARLG